MIDKKKINRKTLYKLCYTVTDRNKYNGKLALSLGSGVIGSIIMQHIYGLSDTSASRAIKLGATAIIGLDFLRYSMRNVKKFNSERSISVLLHWIKTRDLSYEEVKERKEEFNNIEYWKEIERLFYRFDTEVEFDNEIFTFILKLADETMIKEVITDNSYKCYYIDKENEVDVTDISKDFFRRKK